MNTIARTRKAVFFYMLIALFAVSACSTPAPPDIVPLDVDMVLPPVGTFGMDPAKLSEIMTAIQERNETVEDDPGWVRKSYEGLQIRRLTNVSPGEYPQFREFLDNGVAYIIVHPAFFTFFQYPRRLTREDKLSPHNVVELLLEKRPLNAELALLQAQERRMRDFLEFKSTGERLIVLVVPRDYARYSGYTYRHGRDEYRRFLNEVTNMSRSVLYVESEDPNRGYITADDAITLMEFLLSVNAEKIYVGGAYIGRCLEDFYKMLTKEFGREGIFLVPELSDIGPREIDSKIASAILRKDGRIDRNVATRLMETDAYKIQEGKPEICNLPDADFER